MASSPLAADAPFGRPWWGGRPPLVTPIYVKWDLTNQDFVDPNGKQVTSIPVTLAGAGS